MSNPRLFACFLLAATLAPSTGAVTVVHPPAVLAPGDAPQTQPSVASLADGGFIVVFEDGSVDNGFTDPPIPIDGRDGSLEGIVGQLVDDRGRPDGAPFVVNAVAQERQICPEVSADPTIGGFVVGWLDTSAEDRVMLRRFDADARPTSDDIALPSPSPVFCGLGLAVAQDGTVIAAVRTLDEVLAFRVAVDGTVTLTDETPMNVEPTVFVTELIGTVDGGAILVSRFDGTVRLHRLDAGGRWVGPYAATFEASSASATLRPNPEAADEQDLMIATTRPGDVSIHRLPVDDLDALPDSVRIAETASWSSLATVEGDLVLVTGTEGDAPTVDSSSTGRLSARRLSADFAPVGDRVDLDVGLGSRFHAPLDLTVQPDGRFLTVWERSFSGPIDMALFDAEPIPTLTLDERFRVQVRWRDSEGQEGFGVPIPLARDTGGFWFFEPTNLELTVKVLDGRSINGHFWVFNGSLSDVQYELVVTDAETGAIYVHQNPLGTFGSFGDIEALPFP